MQRGTGAKPLVGIKGEVPGKRKPNIRKRNTVTYLIANVASDFAHILKFNARSSCSSESDSSVLITEPCLTHLHRCSLSCGAGCK